MTYEQLKRGIQLRDKITQLDNMREEYSKNNFVMLGVDLLSVDAVNLIKTTVASDLNKSIADLNAKFEKI